MALLKLQTTWKSSRKKHLAYQKINSLHLALESAWMLPLRVTSTKYVRSKYMHYAHIWGEATPQLLLELEIKDIVFVCSKYLTSRTFNQGRIEIIIISKMNSTLVESVTCKIITKHFERRLGLCVAITKQMDACLSTTASSCFSLVEPCQHRQTPASC